MWILVIIALAADGSRGERVFGTMTDRAACVVAGTGAARLLAEANPALAFTWRCSPQAGA